MYPIIFTLLVSMMNGAFGTIFLEEPVTEWYVEHTKMVYVDRYSLYAWTPTCRRHERSADPGCFEKGLPSMFDETVWLLVRMRHCWRKTRVGAL